MAPIYRGVAWAAHQGHGGYRAAAYSQHGMESRSGTDTRKEMALTHGADLVVREKRGAWATQRGCWASLKWAYA